MKYVAERPGIIHLNEREMYETIIISRRVESILILGGGRNLKHHNFYNY